MVKIGIFDPYLDTLGGGEKYILTIAECLSKNHDVHIFWDDNGIRQKAEERFTLDLSHVTLTKDIFSKKSGIIRRFSETRKYDLIIYLSDGSVPTVFSRRLFLHFQFPTEWVNASSHYERVKLLRVNKILCNSQFTKSYIEKRFDKECDVLYPPVDVEHSYTKTDKENIILSVGRHTRPKGIDFKKHAMMVEAFKLIAKKYKDWKLVILTNNLPEDAVHVDELEASVEDFPIEILRDTPRKDVLSFFKKAKIYWHAAGYGEDIALNPELFEHFGIVTVEAMNMGAVPVVFNGGGQKEIVKNGRSGYLWQTEEDLIEKTEFLMTHESDRKMLAKQAFEDSLRFDKRRFCQLLNELIA